mgnify:CR=1 FL=1|jgi:hypothetical protein
MGAPKKPRAKSEKKLKNPNMARPQNTYFQDLMKTEEGRALRKKWSTKPRKNPGRPMGVVDGYTKETLAPLKAKAAKEAERVVEIMSKEYDINDEYSQEALKAAVAIMREPSQNRDKLTAARLVLDFTRSKPAASVEVTVGKAESFLSSLLIEHDGPQSDQMKLESTEEHDEITGLKISSGTKTAAK